MVLLKIAWRNLWRNPLRSGIVMAAMAFGIVVMVFVSGFYNGLMGSYVKNSIKKQYGHIQIHHPEFREYKETKPLERSLSEYIILFICKDAEKKRRSRSKRGRRRRCAKRRRSASATAKKRRKTEKETNRKATRGAETRQGES